MASKLDTAHLLALFRTMRLIRVVESSLTRLFADGEIPGFIHLSIGQEATAAGVCAALEKRDTLSTTHRGHGHVLARGLALAPFFKELMGKDGGVCRGRGGSMHVADRDLGILGANGIVGAGLPIAMGSAVAHQVHQQGGIAVVFFGDGAMAEGVLHETLNMAKLWRLPLLLACESNGWSEFSPAHQQLAFSLDKLVADGARMGLPEINLGLFPGAGGTQRLMCQIPPCRAKELMFTGDQINAEEALALGLCNRVVPAATLMEHTLELAGRIARKSPLVLKLLKRNLRQGMDMTLTSALAHEQAVVSLVLDTADAHEGCRAFMEKRPANFREQ